MKKYKLKSYCKINLSLRVLKRPDNGYHKIMSLMTFCDLYDVVSITKNNKMKDEVSFTGKFKKGIKNNSNTITKTLNFLRKKKYFKKEYFKINVQKNIPHGSGLGGGSSNAANLLTANMDKRDQKFQTTDGFRSRFSQSVPIVSETNAIINGYEFNYYEEVLEEMITSFSIYAKSVNSLTGDNVRISERLYMPTNKLRGFQRGKVGPIDSNDYVGGNYVSSVNIAATLPNVVPNWQNADFSIFLDAGNVWGVDYSSTINDTNKLRSAAVVALDWHTPVGPLSFSYTGVISKASTDKTESFRFNLGTTF